MPAPVIGTMVGTITTNVDSDAKADPQVDVITYTTTITNNSGGDLSDLQFNDTVDPHTTLVANSAIAAVDDSFSTTINVQINPAAPGVLANDFNPNTGNHTGITVSSYGASTGLEQTSLGSPTPTSQSGSVTVNADGSFTYNPPNNAGGITDTFKYAATSGGTTAIATVRIVVSCPTITVTNPVVNSGTAGTAFSQTFTQGGGSGTITWSETGALPSGISLNTSTGVLSGTTSQTGSFPITVTATDQNNCQGTGATYTLTIDCQTITVTNPGVNTGTAGQAFSQTFTVGGNLGTISWSETGSLPSGIALNPTNGVLSGTTTQTGSFPITVKATDTNGCFGTSSYTLIINCQTITVTNPATNTGTAGIAFDQAFSASGILGTANWTTSSTLPAGLTLNSSTGHLSGTPTQTGSFPIVATATDTNSCNGSSSTYTLTIACPTITVNRTGGGSFPQGTYNVSYTGQSATASGSNGTPYTFTISAGALPTGLSLSSAGALSGTPTATGTFNFTIKATDQYGCEGTFANSIAIKPSLTGDSYSNLVNNTQEVITGGTTASPTTPFTFHVTRITANDSPAVTLTTGTFATGAGGSITIAADGTFIYTPPASSNLSSDSFTYTASSDTGSTGTPVSATAIITLNLSNRVWYVNPNNGANGDGRSNNAFNTTGSIPSLSANDIVFVYNNSGTTTNTKSKINLNAANTQLLGQGVTLTVNGYTLVSATSAPTLTNTTSGAPQDVVNVTANGCTISGVTLSNSSAALIKATSVTGLTVNSTTLNPSSAANGITASTVSGTVTISNSTLSGTGTGDMLNISAGIGQWNFTSSPISVTNGRALNVSSKTGGGMSFDATSTVTVSAGTTDGAISLSSNSGAETFAFSKLALTTSGTARALVLSSTGTVSNTDNTSTISTADTAATCGSGNCSAGIDATSTALGLTFKSINVNGVNGHVPVGIRLQSTTGSLSVIGDGTNHANGSGGSISNIVGGSAGNSPIYALTVAGTLSFSSMNFSINTNGYSGPLFDNNATSTVTVNVTGCTFTGVTSSVVQQKALLQFEGGNSSNVTANVQDSFFNGSRTYGVASIDAGAATMNTTINQCGFGTDVNSGAPVNNPGTTITNGPALGTLVSSSSSNNHNYTVSNNTIWGLTGNPWALSVSGSSSGGGMTGFITGNKIGKTGVTGSGCSPACGGIGVLPGLTGLFESTITGNDVRQVNSEGIEVGPPAGAGATGTVKAKIKANTIAEPDLTGSPTFQRAIVVTPVNSGGTSETICIEVGDVFGTNAGDKNNISGAWSSAGSPLTIRLSNNANTIAMTLPGLSPTSGATAAQVQSYLEAHNTVTAGTTVATLGAGINGSASSCYLLLAAGGVDAVLSGPSLVSALLLSPSTRLSGAVDLHSVVRMSGAVGPSLSQDDLDSLVGAATDRWIATGLTAPQVEALHKIEFQVGDLANSYLGDANGDKIVVDRNAQGRGWFVDVTPRDDSEFATKISATRCYTDPLNGAAGRVDLLTAIEHELGHKLGLDDSYAQKDRDSIMYGYLTVGERRTPSFGQANNAKPRAIAGVHHLTLGLSQESAVRGRKPEISSPHTRSLRLKTGDSKLATTLTPVAGCATSGINPSGTAICVDIPTLHDGESITITFQVTVNNPPGLTGVPPGTPQVSNFGTVTGSFTGSPLNTNTVNTPVDLFNSQTTLGSIPNPSNSGSQVTFTATVVIDPAQNPTPPSPVTPTGSVTFVDTSNGNAVLCNAVALSGSGGTATAQCQTSTLSNGSTHNIQAQYSGDGNYDPSNSNLIGQAVNAAPSITAGGGLNYTENQAATAIDTTITVNDVDSANLASAMAQITGNYVNGQDVLSFTNTANITGVFTPATGTLTLTGSDTLANYQAALRSVKYNNTSDNPSTSARTVSWIVNDGSLPSNTAISTINITAVNDPPTLATNTGLSVVSGGTGTIDNTKLKVTDPDNTTSQLVFTIGTAPTHGTLKKGALVLAGGNTFTQADLDGTQISYTHSGDGSTADSFTFTVSDGAGGTIGTTTFNVGVNCGLSSVVKNANDAGADSLRDAIATACVGDTISFSNTTAGGATNFFDNTLHTINLISGELAIAKNLTITGPGANLLTINGSSPNRVFNITSGTVTISKLQISGGTVTGANNGGGMLNAGTLTLINTTVSGNTAANQGGGLYNSGTLTLVNTTLSGNTSALGGGGVYSSGAVTFINTTVSGNNSNSSGGGVYFNGSTLSSTNATITNNRSDNDNSGAETGGGIFRNAGTVTLKNTIVAGNFRGTGATRDDVGGALDAASSFNLIGDGTGMTGVTNGTNNNQVGSGISPINALLGGLGSNGGATQTHLLLPGSPAINAGSNAILPADTFDLDNDSDAGEQLPVDQRGATFNRIVNTTVDIGAAEVNYTVTASAGTPQSAVINTAFGTALQATVKESGNNQSGIAVIFTPPVSGASGSFTGGNPANVNTNVSGIATAPTFTANGTTGGPYNVVASLAGNLATVNFSLNNTAAGQTITVNTHAPANATYNTQFTVAATASSGLAVVYSSSGSCTNVGATFTMTNGTGTCTVIYSQPGDSNNSAASQVTESVNAQKASQTITFNTITNKTFGDADFTINAAASSGLPVSLSASGNCTVTTPAQGTVHITGAGSCTITAAQAGSTNFSAAASVLQSFNIAKATQTISFNTIANKTFGDADFTINPTASSGLPVSLSASGNCTVTTPAQGTVHITGAGSCTISAAQTGNNNYSAATDVPQSFTIAKANQTVTVNTHAPTSAAFNTSFTVAATSSSGLSVAYSSTGSCTNVGATFTITSANGTCTVKYDQAGDSNFNSASQATESVTAQKASQTITFNALSSKNFGDADFSVSATASSSLPVSFTASGQCTVSTNTVHLTAAGSCTVTAKQAGDSNYNAATDVLQSFTIGKATTATTVSSSSNPSNLGQTITFTVTVTGPVGAGTPTGAVAFKDGGSAITCTNVGGQTLNVSGAATCQTSSLTAGTHAISADYGGDTNFSSSTGTLLPKQVVNNQALVSFSASTYTVNEADGFVHVIINRTGDTSVAFSVDYATDDSGAPTDCSAVNTGLASSRCDYDTFVGSLRFAANQGSAALDIPINQDSYTEGPESFTVNLSNPTGAATLIGPFSATVTINDSASPATNTIDDTTAFVRQHYHDFLNREPDAAGLAFWKNNIDKCNDAAQRQTGQTLAQCIEVQRILTSAAFFLSIEFMQTGTFVRSFYVAALDRPATGGMPAFTEWLRDTQAVQRGVVVGQGSWQATLDANRLAFMQDFVMRVEFVGLYPTTDTPTQYVNKLYQHALSRPPSATELSDGLSVFGNSTAANDPTARGQALLKLTQTSEFQNREVTRAFVQFEYFGYLRRNPNDAPDGNFNGYNFWLNKLNSFNGDFLKAEMVKAFITSNEYRRRFGP